MVEVEAMAALTQFGVAGLICWMWITERRAAATRERQLSELQERILRERRELDVLVTVVNDNTRALTALEVGQRGVAAVLERFDAAAHVTR